MNLALLAVTVLCLAASAFFSVAEGSLLHFSWARIEDRLKNEERLARLNQKLSSRQRMLFAAVLLNSLFNVLFVVLVSFQIFAGEPASITLALIEVLAWSIGGIVIFAETIPRGWARRSPESALLFSLPIMSFSTYVLKYPLIAIEGLGETLARTLGVEGRELENGELQAQIRQAVSESEMEGEILEQEREMFESIFDFREAEVAEIMTPRTDMVCIDVTSSLKQAIDLALEQGHSRLPVFEENRDNIIGLLYVKDLLRLWNQNSSEISLRELLRKPLYVPESKRIWDLLRDMQAQRMHMAIVLDEYGGTAGLVTVEDIVEEIVGDIQDEYDRVAEIMVRHIDAHTIEVDGKVHIEEVNEELKIDLPEDEEYETIGGFIFSRMGRVPVPGETYRTDSVEFTILDADERHIISVRARSMQVAEEGSEKK